jgi:hypothetical protein
MECHLTHCKNFLDVGHLTHYHQTSRPLPGVQPNPIPIMQKPTVGQKVFMLNIGNNTHRTPSVLKPAIVKKVGREYFYAVMEEYESSDHMQVKFRISDGLHHSNFSPGYRIIESEQAWLDEREKEELHSLCKRQFDAYRATLDLDTLRKIKALLPIT